MGMKVMSSPMRKSFIAIISALFLLSSLSAATTAAPGNGQGGGSQSNENRGWSKTEISQAIPRDLVIDERGLAFVRGKSGEFEPHGHSTKFGANPTKGKPVRPAPTPLPSPTTLPVISNSEWRLGGGVQSAAGRLYFFMPTSSSKLNDVSTWSGFVCSGTVVTDSRTDQSLILTAAHCVYDDVNKVFAQRVMFIPNQAASGTPTDRYCFNDILGCWIPSHGVVDSDWSSRTFPANAPWDYGFYVVNNANSHLGNGGDATLVLDVAIGNPLAVSYSTSIPIAYTYALGYSYNQDPKFMYCAQTLGTNTALVPTGQWWLSSCGLTGGSSGGPWMQTSGSGPVFSVNSWGYSGSLGMAGPRLGGSSAQCLFNASQDLAESPKQGGLIPAKC